MLAMLTGERQTGGGAAGPSGTGHIDRRAVDGLSTKLHVRAEGYGMPLVLLVGPGQRHECHFVQALVDRGAPVGTQDTVAHERVAGDKSRSYPYVHTALGRWSARVLILPGRTSGGGRASTTPHISHPRHLSNRREHFRWVATRYEKRDAHDLSFVTLDAIVL